MVLAVSIAAAWALPALGGTASPSNARLSKRIDRLERRLASVESRVAAVQARRLTVQQVAGPLSPAAQGTIPGWVIGQATCPYGSTLVGGGPRFDGVYANKP